VPRPRGGVVPTLPIPLLRDAVARAAVRSSLRSVAREVSMSPNGVRDFVQGATPRGATRLKLERWLVSQGRIARPPNVGQFVRLLNELAGDLSPKQAVHMGRHVAALLVESYEERRLMPPGWVQQLVRHYEPPSRTAGDVA
jgi:hypothetical protein